MKLRTAQLVITGLVLVSGAWAQAAGAKLCEASFISKSSMDSLILESAILPQNLPLSILNAKAAGSARFLYGRVGGSVETFEEVIDLSLEKLEGLETRNSAREGEGQTLDLHVRLRSSMNDIWKVPLASEMDALAFLISSKSGFKQQVVDSFEANGFVLKAIANDISPVSSTAYPNEVALGSEYKLVAIETAITRDLHKDSVLVLKVQSLKTSEVIEIKSARTSHGLKVARELLKGHEVGLSLRGNTFVLKENLAPGRLAPRSSAL
ncbi:MAG: hypothetical protein EOP05_16315 [Proteobacteria bacterium]|nr:MAG: hypothetical protein EOP05_16315 [Pseudomonadota bacterium]